VPSAGRADVAVTFSDSSGDSSVVVLPQLSSGSGLDASATIERSTGAGGHSGSLLIADVDSDGRAELVVGNGGTWARDVSAEAPGIRIFAANASGDTLAAPEEHVAGGTELAGASPSLVLADFGAVLPSRHPIDEVAATAHVSTETASALRHVTCSDCHDSHEATTAPTAAPTVQGLLAGSWGVGVTYAAGVPSFTGPARSDTSYGVCFKCHSSYAALDGRTDIAAQVAPASGSVHAIVQGATSTVAAGTFDTSLSAWSGSSVLYCTDCHGDAGAAPSQAHDLHESDAAPILASPYAGVASSDPSLLCYDCHRYDVYATGAHDGPGMSGFVETSPAKRLHALHVGSRADGGLGISCGACHASHGSALPHLLRTDIGFTPSGADAGTCVNACHSVPSRSYP
jgi:hypothetical protein